MTAFQTSKPLKTIVLLSDKVITVLKAVKSSKTKDLLFDRNMPVLNVGKIS